MVKILNYLKLFWLSMRKEIESTPVSNYIIAKYLDKASKYSERLDNKYTTCDLEKLKVLVKLIPIRKQKYSTEHDCNKFAYEFYALIKNIFPTLAIGICHVKTKKGLHAMNWCIYKNKVGGLTFSYLEPQEGKISYYNYSPYFMVI